MSSWKHILIISLAIVCFGCQKKAKETEQPITSMKEEIRKIETAAEAEKAASKQATIAPVTESSPVTETVAANPIIEKLNQLLEQAAVYDYDKSRLPLSEANELIKNASDTDKKLIEKRLDEFLKSEATSAGKDFVCRELSIIGTEQSVPVLSSMLTDANTADMVRYALERIPGTAVDDALIDSLGKTSGTVKVGVINTLGERRNPKAVGALEGLIYDEDIAVASAAVGATGKIGGFEAAKVLSGASKKTSGELRNLVLHSYVDCANQFAAKGDKVMAVVIFQQLYDSNEPVQIRIAALRGIVTSTGGQSASILSDALKKEGPIQSAAITLVREVPAEEILKAAVAELPNLPPAAKMQMLTALADCGYSASLSAAVAAMKEEDISVRLAALKAIGKLGGASDVQLLAETVASGGTEERELARESLYQLRGADVDSAIVTAIPAAEPKVKVELIRAIGERNIKSAAEILLATAKDADQKVRIESIRVLRIVAEPEQLAALIELLKGAQSDSEVGLLEKTVAAVACKISDENQRASAVIAAMKTTTDVMVKCSFINVLGRINGNSALEAVRGTLKNEDVRIQVASIRVLGDWPSPEPMEDLLKVVQNPPDKMRQTMAFRAYVNLAGLDSPRPAQETVRLYSEAMKLAPGVSEKQMVMAGLSNVKSYAAIEAAAKFLGDEQIGVEAAAATIQIAKKTKGEDNPEQTKAALKKVIETVKSELLKKQAEEALSKIK